MRIKAFFTVLTFLATTTTLSFANNSWITARESAQHIGKTATVCGSVASTKYASQSKGQPTFLNLDAPYPRQIFTIVIFGEDRSAFGSPENIYAGKNVCVTGLIKDYKGTPEIIAKNPSQITLTQ